MSDGEDLGSTWRRTGFGMKGLGVPTKAHAYQFDLYGRMPNSGADEANVGARIRYDTTCTNCGKRFIEGDAITAELAPDMAGTAHHTDCTDPKLERAIDDD